MDLFLPKGKNKVGNNLKLKEMLYELTPRCNKNCKYCGSSGVMNKQKESSKEVYDKIVNELLNYPPEEITLTGGEPSICSYFEEVVDKLSGKMNVKIVSNGTIFSKDIKILNKLFQIGYSINTEEDVNNFKNKILPQWKDMFLIELPRKITMITNFGTHNIWEFEKLFNFFKESKFSVWQIQLTMGEYQLNETGIEYLKDKITNINSSGKFESLFPLSSENKQLIVLADNLQEQHDCTAGINSCSITYDGLVVPCLSERSWRKDLRINGDLKKQTLEEIWEHSFKDKRFKNINESCRECIKYPQCKKIEKKENNKLLEEMLKKGVWPPEKYKNPYDPYKDWDVEITMYGTGSPTTFVYATFSPGSSSIAEGQYTHALYGVTSSSISPSG